MKIKHPTYVSLVLELLVKRDDFMRMQEIAAELRINHNQASASLHSLQAHKAVDSVTGPDGLWWFATPDLDTRMRTLKEVAHHTKDRPPGKYPRRKPKAPTDN